MEADDVFVLLDDQGPQALSRLYTELAHEHRCVDPAALEDTCAAIQTDLSAGLHAVLLADYEWGTKLLGAGCAALPAGDRSCLRVLMFHRLQQLDAAQVDAWLAAHRSDDAAGPSGTIGLHAAITREHYNAAIERIHEAIADGETYQVNFTYRWHGRALGAPPVETEMNPPAWMILSKALRFTTRSLMIGKARARQGSIVIVSPSLKCRRCN